MTTDDLLARAEALPRRDLAYYEWWDLSRDMWPELIDEIKQQAAYISRLEAAYLLAEQARIYEASKRFGMNYTESDISDHARTCLEQIKRGEQG